MGVRVRLYNATGPLRQGVVAVLHCREREHRDAESKGHSDVVLSI